MCSHPIPCPNAWASDAAAARVIADHTEQGWSLLCNSVILFTDGGMLRPTPDGQQPASNSPRRVHRCRVSARQGKQKGRRHCTVRPAGRH